MLNMKKKEAKAAPSVSKPEKPNKTSSKGSKYDVQIAQCREVIEENKAKIKELLAAKLNSQSGEWEIGSTVYYPAPPQKKVIPCILEIEEDSNGEIVYFARPICFDKKTGSQTLSKRHYSLGTDLSSCKDLYREPPASEKPKKAADKGGSKTSTKKVAKKTSSKVEEKEPVKKPTLGGKKKLGKK